MLLAFSLPLVAVIARAGAALARARQLGGAGLRGRRRARDRHDGPRRRLGLAQGLVRGERRRARADRGGTTTAGKLAFPSGPIPSRARSAGRTCRRRPRAELAKARAAGRPFAAVLTDDRAVTAELLYYMRDEPTPVLAWREGAPHDHFELTRPFTAATTGPVLLVSLERTPARPRRSQRRRRSPSPAAGRGERRAARDVLRALGIQGTMTPADRSRQASGAGRRSRQRFPRRSSCSTTTRAAGPPSLLFSDPVEIIAAETPEEVPAALERLEAAVGSGLHAAGFFAYELGYVLEPKLAGLMPKRGATCRSSGSASTSRPSR